MLSVSKQVWHLALLSEARRGGPRGFKGRGWGRQREEGHDRGCSVSGLLKSRWASKWLNLITLWFRHLCDSLALNSNVSEVKSCNTGAKLISPFIRSFFNAIEKNSCSGSLALWDKHSYLTADFTLLNLPKSANWDVLGQIYWVLEEKSSNLSN